jgi:hypothetical protein
MFPRYLELFKSYQHFLPCQPWRTLEFARYRALHDKSNFVIQSVKMLYAPNYAVTRFPWISALWGVFGQICPIHGTNPKFYLCILCVLPRLIWTYSACGYVGSLMTYKRERSSCKHLFLPNNWRFMGRCGPLTGMMNFGTYKACDLDDVIHCTSFCLIESVAFCRKAFVRGRRQEFPYHSE